MSDIWPAHLIISWSLWYQWFSPVVPLATGFSIAPKSPRALSPHLALIPSISHRHALGPFELRERTHVRCSLYNSQSVMKHCMTVGHLADDSRDVIDGGIRANSVRLRVVIACCRVECGCRVDLGRGSVLTIIACDTDL